MDTWSRDDSTAGDDTSLAAKIKLLFRTRLCPVDEDARRRLTLGENPATVPQREYGYKEVAVAVGITPTYLYYLHDGQRDNPNVKVLQKLAKFFRVPVHYLTDDSISATALSELATLDYTDPSPSERHLADRLDTLFDTVRPGGGPQPYSNGEVATAVGCTADELGALRAGTNSDPSLQLIQRLAQFFSAPIGYLTGSNDPHIEGYDDQLDKFRKLCASRSFPVAMRASQVQTSGGLEAVANIIESVIKMENEAAAARDQENSTP